MPSQVVFDLSLGDMPGNVYFLNKQGRVDQQWLSFFDRIRPQFSKGTVTVAWNDLDFTSSNITSIVTRNHSDLQNINSTNYYHLTQAQYTDLTDGGDSTLHFHASDRNRANHTGTQLASTISDFEQATNLIVGDSINFSSVTIGNTAATETDAYSNPIPGNTLDVNGDILEFICAGSFANTASVDKQIKVKFGASTIFDTGSLAITTAETWEIRCSIVRTGASTQKCTTTFITSDLTVKSKQSYSTSSETLSSPSILKLTLNGTNANDVVAEMFRNDLRRI